MIVNKDKNKTKDSNMITVKEKRTPENSQSFKLWEQINNLKELIAILIFVGGLVAGYVTLRNDVTELKKDVDNLTIEIKRTNTILMEQSHLNGRIIQYLEQQRR